MRVAGTAKTDAAADRVVSQRIVLPLADSAFAGPNGTLTRKQCDANARVLDVRRRRCFRCVRAAGESARLLWKVISAPAAPDAEAVVVAAPAPADGRKRPLLVLPHGSGVVETRAVPGDQWLTAKLDLQSVGPRTGGPHSVTPSEFSLYAAGFAALGYVCLYRTSAGACGTWSRTQSNRMLR